MLVTDSVGLQVPGIFGSRWLVIKPGTKQEKINKSVEAKTVLGQIEDRKPCTT